MARGVKGSGQDPGQKWAEQEYDRLVKDTENCRAQIKTTTARLRTRIKSNQRLMTHYNSLIAAYGEVQVAASNNGNGTAPEEAKPRPSRKLPQGDIPCKRKSCTYGPFTTPGMLKRHMRQVHGVDA